MNYVQSINESSLFDEKLNFEINLQPMNRYSLKLSRTLLTLAALMLASVTQATVMFTPFGNVTSYYQPTETLPYLRQMHLINNTAGTSTFELFDTAYDSDVPNSKTNRTYKLSSFSNNSATLADIDIKYPTYVSIADGRFSAQFSTLTKLIVWSSSSPRNSLTWVYLNQTNMTFVTQKIGSAYVVDTVIDMAGTQYGAHYVRIGSTFAGVKLNDTSPVVEQPFIISSLSRSTANFKFWSIAYTDTYKMLVSYYSVTGASSRSEYIDYKSLSPAVGGTSVTKVATITDATLHVNYSTSDNLNSDHIYCMIQNHAGTVFKVGVVNITTLKETYTSYSAAFSSTTYNTLTRSMKFLNAGTQAYMIGVPEQPSDRVYIYAKTLTNFAAAENYTALMPTVLGQNTISAEYTYDVHKILEMGVPAYYLYYHLHPMWTSQIIKYKLFACHPTVNPYLVIQNG